MTGQLTEITPELREKVLRAYTVKKMSLSMIYRLIACKSATLKILDEVGIIKKKFVPGKTW